MVMFDSVTESLGLTVEDGLGKCSQTVECLPDKRKALDPIPGNGTEEMQGGERRNSGVIEEPRRHQKNSTEIRQKWKLNCRDQRAQNFCISELITGVCASGSTYNSSVALG